MGIISSYGKIEEKKRGGMDRVERGGLKQGCPNQNTCGRLTINCQASNAVLAT